MGNEVIAHCSSGCGPCWKSAGTEFLGSAFGWNEMLYRTFLGLGGNFVLHDVVATEGQGPIGDRTQEHLATSDQAIVMERQLLLNAVQRVRDGEDAPHVIRRAEDNHLEHLGGMDFELARALDWKEHVRRVIAKRQGHVVAAGA